MSVWYENFSALVDKALKAHQTGRLTTARRAALKAQALFDRHAPGNGHVVASYGLSIYFDGRY